jgi:hypothetical protein
MMMGKLWQLWTCLFLGYDDLPHLFFLILVLTRGRVDIIILAGLFYRMLFCLFWVYENYLTTGTC